MQHTMRKLTNKLTALALAGALCLGPLAGCGNTESELQPFDSSSDSLATEGYDSPAGDVTSVGTFTTQDVNGERYDETYFQQYKLTLVNVFTTWCSPCVEEIPYLDQLRQELAELGVGVVGIVLDAVNEDGSVAEDALETAQELAESTNAGYPFLLPDETWLNGRVKGINAVPETFFVDSEGNIVGEAYLGGRTLDEWKAVVEQELANLEDGQ